MLCGVLGTLRVGAVPVTGATGFGWTGATVFTGCGLANPKSSSWTFGCGTTGASYFSTFWIGATLLAFNLDPNFVSLSQLSSEDMGIVSKKPSERKKFVASIVESIEVYNDIYRNAFANYFEVNVKNLALSEALLSDFSKQIKEDLEHLCDHIDDVMIDLEEELSNKKKKKRS